MPLPGYKILIGRPKKEEKRVQGQKTIYKQKQQENNGLFASSQQEGSPLEKSLLQQRYL